jgi:hypothetical protein
MGVKSSSRSYVMRCEAGSYDGEIGDSLMPSTLAIHPKRGRE